MSYSHFHELQATKSIADMLENISLNDKDKTQLNRNLANLVRKYFRHQIKAQRNVSDGSRYAPRSRKASKKDKTFGKAMFTGLSKSLMTQADKDSFAVGFTGVAGIVARLHNEGAHVEYGYRIKSWFNNQTNRFVGGVKRQGVYKLPQRVMIGWNNELESLVMNEILKAMEPK